MNKKNLAKGMLYVFLANIINLIFGLINNFALPKYLSVDSYADMKTFTLFLSIAGILHFGYEDGMYLKYGGEDISNINAESLNYNIGTLRIFQAVISASISIFSMLTRNHILLVFGFMLLPYNMCMYFRNFFQAVGKFDIYGRILNLASIFIFLLNMTLIFLVRTDIVYYYLSGQIIIYILIWGYGEHYVRKLVTRKMNIAAFSVSELFENIKSGFSLMLGNFSSILLTSMDRWFVKGFLDNFAFAQYSFAVSTENFLNVAVTPVSTTLYNYFCRTNSETEIGKIKRAVIITAPFVASSAFLGDWIIRIILESYTSSVKVIYLLFASQICFIIIKSIYVNLYKAQKRQSVYFKKLIIVIVFGFVSNACAYLLFRNKEAFAWATLLSAILWLCISNRDFPSLNLSIKELFFIFLAIIGMVFWGFLVGSIIGFIFYILLVMAFAMLLFSHDLKYYLKYISNTISSRLK